MKAMYAIFSLMMDNIKARQQIPCCFGINFQHRPQQDILSLTTAVGNGDFQK